MNCGKCSRFCTGKFCPDCGTPLAKPPTTTTTTTNSRVTPTRTRMTPPPAPTSGLVRRDSQERLRQNTLTALHQPKPETARGQVIRQQMQELADEVYGDTPNDGAQPINRVHGARSKAITYDVTPLPDSWRRGPLDPAGKVMDASDRNLMCMDVQNFDCVVGSADHGLKVFNMRNGQLKRTLYNKKYGHTEWVTSCKFLSDGKIVSGGMDSKLCLWDARVLKCQDLTQHTASISALDVNGNDLILSASYDRTLILWDGRGQVLTRLTGHSQPVLTFAWIHNTVVSGDRGGGVLNWDIDTSQCVSVLRPRGGGQCSAIGYLVGQEENYVIAGDQSGQLSVWDIRAGGGAISERVLHPGGAVSAIKGMSSSFGPYVVSAGADRRICVTDSRKGFEPLHVFTDHRDFIYSMELLGPLIISGAGNGWMLVHDGFAGGKCLYGLGANQAAVRCIHPCAQFLVAAGDDGKV
eukprot:PhF_6_TR22367/c0_g1_i1/m.31708/K10260/FBXW7, SEL10; F-box and WD-40 domain protein 7